MQCLKLTIRNAVSIPLRYSGISDRGASVFAEFVSFAGFQDGKEHFAVRIGQDQSIPTPKVRIHSECITGDVFHSGFCDCGDQLREAIRNFAVTSGILIYLRQEGRGIGLFSKLDSYDLQQNKGLDTFAANEALGFAPDLRDFRIAAYMLHALGVNSIELHSNNPEKQKVLEQSGVIVERRVPTTLHINSTNKKYLQTKADNDHRFSLDPRD
jgi:GTP cyclohydrolase II